MQNLRNKQIASKILFVAGLAISIFGLTIIKEAIKCLHWEKTECTIIDSDIKELPIPDRKTDRNLTPNIVYEYKNSKGRVYFSNKISYIDLKIFPLLSDNYYAGNFDEVKDFISNFELGSKHPVYFNPKNPADAILDNSLKLPVFIPLFFGLAMIYASLHFHLFAYIARKKANLETAV